MSTAADITSELQKLLDEIEPAEKEIKAQEELRIEAARVARKAYEEYLKIQEAQHRKEMQALREKKRISDLVALSKRRVEELRTALTKKLEEDAAKQNFDALRAELELWFNNPQTSKLDDYQRDDIMAIVHAWRSGEPGILNMNGMGLGKTAEAAVSLAIIKSEFYEKEGRQPRVLWVTKKSLRQSALDEVHLWNPDFLGLVVDGNPDMREMAVKVAVANNAMAVINYRMVSTTPELLRVAWDIIVMDEVHQLKGGANSSQTQVFKDVDNLIQGNLSRGRPPVGFLLMLSGSPAQNRMEEVYPYLHMFDSRKFPTLKQFKRMFTGIYGGLNLDAILRELEGRFIKQPGDVIKRPDKTIVVVDVEMTEKQQEIYDMVKHDLVLQFENKLLEDETLELNITSFLTQLIRLRQIVLWPASISFTDVDDVVHQIDCRESGKLDQAVELIEEKVADGENIVVWSAQFNEPLFALGEMLKTKGITFDFITGQTKNPRNVEKAFQQNEFRVLLCNRQAAGEGYNFQKTVDWPGGAKYAIFLDKWYTPSANEQCQDRIWRKNSTEGVLIYELYTEESTDRVIESILAHKENELSGLKDPKRFIPLKKLMGMI